MSECVDQDESGLLCTLPAGHDGDHVATGGPGIILASWPRIADAGAVMSEWLGLHNPERHKSFSGEWAECLPDLGGCLSECGDGDPCRCCLASEVERLTALLKAADDVVASQDRRIEAALAAIDRYYRDGDGIGVVVGVEDALRGESDE